MRWLVLFGWLLPAPAFACAVCGIGPHDVASWAFLRGTALLSLMPLSVIGGIVYYLYRETKKANRPAEGEGAVGLPAFEALCSAPDADRSTPSAVRSAPSPIPTAARAAPSGDRLAPSVVLPDAAASFLSPQPSPDPV